MKSSTVGMLALAAAARLVNAHTTVHAIWVNDADQGAGNSDSGYIRSPPNNSPITDVTSKSMTCNVNNKATAKTIDVKSGDKITFEWHHETRSASDDIIASSHKGPIVVYMAPTDKGTAGNGWVKIAEEGYSNGVWAVENLIKNKGKHSATIPNVAPGEYLLRPEIIALHEGNRQNGAQFYMECVQVKVSGGSKTLPAGVSIPGAYTATDKGVLFDIYNSFSSYPIPGPPVWNGASGSSSSDSVSTPASAPTSAPPASAPTSAPIASASSSFTTLVKQPSTTSATAPEISEPATTTSADDLGCPASTPSSTSNTASVPATDFIPQPSSAVGRVKIFSQCGGLNYQGSNACDEGLTCKQWNPYYHQCVSA
ncbi:glycosyl hydrolase family 61-domain-containing protein [Aspergillus coremiiformis]|uniref:AA9 family lytic polysaccharide monooxygenase n=1 Tax=Aspergillus coremiiformis TaxID=138285 RepID=A0A5N6YY18_9EURO|nr:glycosyl hydrolase family 61-domain-containing protein [Aspergillus coremiiformis]